MPGKPDPHARIPGFASRCVRVAHRAAQSGRRVEIRREVGEHVPGRRAQRTRARQRRQVPVGDDFPVGVVPRREFRLHRRRERDGALAHAQRRENAEGNEVLVAHARLERERVAQQSDAEVRILVRRADVARQLVSREKGVHLVHRIIGIGIGRVAWRHVRRHAGQARRLRGEVEQRDLLAAARRNVCRRRQELGHGVVEPHLAAGDHVGQNRGREGLGDRPDLEDAARVHADRDVAAAARGIEQSDDDALAVLGGVGEGLDAGRQHRADGGIGRQRLLQCEEQREGESGVHARI